MFEPLEVHDLFVHAESFLPCLIQILSKGQKYFCVCCSSGDGIPLAGDCINCILMCRSLREQFMIMTKTSVDNMCMYDGKTERKISKGARFVIRTRNLLQEQEVRLESLRAYGRTACTWSIKATTREVTVGNRVGFGTKERSQERQEGKDGTEANCRSSWLKNEHDAKINGRTP